MKQHFLSQHHLSYKTALFQKSVGAMLLYTLSFCNFAQAAVVEGLYEAEIPVANQGKAERTRAMSIGLAEVIAKISGDAKAPGLEGVGKAIQKPSRYVQQYRYKRIRTSVTNPAQSQAKQLVWFRFDEKAINQILRQNKLPVWGRTRPTTLAWIAVEQDGARFILGGDANEDLKYLIEQSARRRGLALKLPLLDIEDQQKVNYADIWGDFQANIMAASERYRADAILVGKMFLTPNDEWQVIWSLFENGRHLRWQGRYPLMSDAMKVGVAGALKSLAERYAQVFAEDQPSEISLSVEGVADLSAFARLSKYLDSLEQVKGVYATRIDSESANFRLDIRGNPEGLRQTIALGKVLAEAQMKVISLADVQDSSNAGSDLLTPFATDNTLVSIDPDQTSSAMQFHYKLLR